MRYLFDSNALYWFVIRPEALRRQTVEALCDPDAAVFYSAINLWELSIKRAKGRIDFDHELVLAAVEQQNFVELPITTRHGLEAAGLPPHHHDPFDRMLIAQARLEGLTLVTKDRAFWQYRVLLLEA